MTTTLRGLIVVTVERLTCTQGSARRRRTIHLGTDAVGARTSRAELSSFLTPDERAVWLEPAELACTELVTNALLHAHSDITVTLTVDPDDQSLRVEVSDRSPDLPLQRTPGQQATTGRGMTLVAALTSEHGVRANGDAGKTVWFVLRGGAVEESEADLLGMWDDGSWDLTDLPPGPLDPDGTEGSSTAQTATGAGAGSPVADPSSVSPSGAPQAVQAVQAEVAEVAEVAVLLDQMPPTLWLAAGEHHDTMLRELVLYLAARPTQSDGGVSDGGSDVIDMAAADKARTILSGAVTAAVVRAQQNGTARSALPGGHPGTLPWVPGPLTLELRVQANVVPAFAALQDTLDLAERLAHDGLLLARPGLPEIVAVRDWACEQVLAQHRGAPSAPWPGTDQERFAAPSEGDGASLVVDVADLLVPDQAAVIADDSNRIVAISDTMADLVGWPVREIVGRRIVTLIPHALREAHVAGFSRHLTTGRAQLLGLTLNLPVLHADGYELPCRVVIEQAATLQGRPLYRAVFELAPATTPSLQALPTP